jgi:hypothetical protein
MFLLQEIDIEPESETRYSDWMCPQNAANLSEDTYKSVPRPLGWPHHADDLLWVRFPVYMDVRLQKSLETTGS